MINIHLHIHLHKLSHICPEKLRHMYTKIHIGRFATALLIIVPQWKQSKWFPSTGNWISCSIQWNQFSSVQSLSRVWLFVTPWVAGRQASLSITNSQSSLRLTSIESVMPSSHLILCHPLLLLPPIPPSVRVFTNESTLHMRWAKVLEFQL